VVREIDQHIIVGFLASLKAQEEEGYVCAPPPPRHAQPSLHFFNANDHGAGNIFINLLDIQLR
jgi:hypothetical protein